MSAVSPTQATYVSETVVYLVSNRFECILSTNNFHCYNTFDSLCSPSQRPPIVCRIHGVATDVGGNITHAVGTQDSLLLP